MLKDFNLPDDRHFENGTDNEPIEFYLNALCNSARWDLLLGYFSSASINILSLGFATFIHNGGILRLIINNVLSKPDKNAIILSKTISPQELLFDLTDIQGLKNSLNRYDAHFFECLAWLISNERIQIKIIAPKESSGISHYKSGLFYDEQEVLYFHGSSNMTAYGLLNNLEEINITTSWDNSLSQLQIKRYSKRFETIFNGQANNVKYLEIQDTIEAIRDNFGDKSINELIIQEQELLKLKKETIDSNPRLLKTLQKTSNTVENIANEPCLPYLQGPRPYQVEAYRNWCLNKYRGLFAMATGTGKTITALNCLLNEYRNNHSYRSIIVVPTIALVEQWKKECIKFNFKQIYIINSKSKWQNEIASIKTEYLLNDRISFVIIITYASFIKPRFQSVVNGMPDDTIFIADETHNMGAPNVAKCISKLNLPKRIGLSATPERKYDDSGNDLINNFFNITSSYTFSYSMEDAINNGVLCRYKYHPHVVHLTQSEMDNYIQISKELSRLINSNPQESFFENELIKMKLLERKRIISKAVNKLSFFKSIIEEEFTKRGDLKYTLVYVPEGAWNIDEDEEFSSVYENLDLIEDSVNDESIIKDYTKVVRNIDERILVEPFTSKTSNRESILSKFAIGEIDVLTSMKCLDEGVDVPRAELAIFCASTGNPRQFVQRRGRVLRTHPKKTFAVIHDLVVAPKINPDPETYEVERKMLQKELERVISFSSLSINKMDTYFAIKDIMEFYQLNLYQK